MTGYTPTHIGIPKNHADFERKAVVLFRELLGDPDVKRLGRSGQGQHGIDLLGYRDGDHKKLVGVQCKKKQPNKALTAKEVRDEIRKALKFKPLLSEYIIITTSGDDTKLDQLALQLTRQQREKGRKVKIQVWGWDTLEDHIDRYLAAKEAFDPGASPALKEVKATLDRIEETQSTQATADQVASLAAKFNEGSPTENEQLPVKFADSELSAEIIRINRRRGFAEAKTIDELVNLAERVLHGDLARASANLQSEALETAARSSALPETLQRAKSFHLEALKRNSKLDTSIYDALLPAAEGDTDQTLQALRQLNTPQSRSATLAVLIRTAGGAKAMEWIKSSRLEITDLDAGGAIILLLQRIENEEYDKALTEAESLSEDYLNDRPASRMVKSGLLLASALPKDQRGVPFRGIPINARMLRFNSLANTPIALAKARVELEKVLFEADALRLVQLRPFLEEQVLWLNLEIKSTNQDARQQIEKEIKDPKHTLRRVRLALAYGVPFNREALSRTLEAAREFGKWSDEEQFAAFLLAWFDRDLSELAAFFDAHREDLYAQKQFDLGTLLGIEVEALVRVRRFDDARTRVAEGRGTLIDQDTATQMEELIASVEQGDEVERLKKLYESGGDLTHLRLLIGTLVDKQDHRQLAVYAPKLLKESQHVDDYGLAQQALFADDRYQEVIALAQDYPALHRLNNDFVAAEGWANFYLGKIMAARAIARALVGLRENSSDRELDINTAVETGDWSYLQAIVAREVTRLEKLDARVLIRLARIAFESGSLYVDKFRDAAIKREPDNPEVLLAAYTLSVERGDEYQESRTHEWFQKAVALSGESGPVQTVSLKEVIARSAGWNKRVNDIDGMIADVKVPLYLAARSLNRQPIEFLLGTAIRNAKSKDTKAQFPVLAFAGSRALFDLSGIRRLALDLTTIFTLDFLGILQKAIDAFDQIVISPTSLSSLFADRQSIRFRQPSEVTKASAIRKMLANGRLRVFKTFRTDAETAAAEIDPDLHSLLEKARANKGVVIRSAPVHKLQSFLEEEADLSSYQDVLTDTHAALAAAQSRISATVAKSASAYLSQVDRGWPKKPSLNKSSIVYLDELAVTYLYHVGVLEDFVASVATVYVAQEVENRCNALLRGEEFSSDLLGSIERIRATLNAGLEKGNIVFSSRRTKRRDETEDELGFGFPSLDILSNLADMDAIAVDDRFLNKETIWNDGSRQIPCVSTLEILLALNGRGIISEAQKYAFLHRLREGGYYTVPTDVSELLSELGRSTVEDEKLVESKELSTIRENLTIALRNRMNSPLEGPWVDYTRAVIIEALRRLWTEESSSLASIVPRADWLLAALPMPNRLVRNSADDAFWSTATQRTSAFIGLLLSSPAALRERQIEYSNWIETRLANPTRIHQPALFARAITTLSEVFQKMLEAEADVPINLRKRVLADLIMNLHPNIRAELVNASNIAAAVGLKTTPLVTFNGTHTLQVGSFVAALRSAIAGKTSAVVTMGDGSKRDVQLHYVKPGPATVSFDDAKFAFQEVELLATSKPGRKRALERVFSQRPLTAEEEDRWFKQARQPAGFSAAEYTDLLEQLRTTPESEIASLSTPQRLGAENLVPADLAYYVRLVGPVQKTQNTTEYLEGERKGHCSFLLKKGFVGLRRLAFSAVSRRFVPFEQLESVALGEIAKLTAAEDPFSLIFGLEVCQHRLSLGEKAAGSLGTKFLKRLFGDEAWLQSRLELFSACAVIATVTLRSSANDPEPPSSWFRLAALSHAGVLTAAVRGIRKTTDFLKWSTRDFGSTYLWHTVVDGREDPRWESEWIAPPALKAELLGRCYNALMLLPSAKQPKMWKQLINAALDKLDTKLLAFFPGPLDGFFPYHSLGQVEGAFNEVKSILKKRSSFKRAPGIILMAYSGAIDQRLKDEIFRLLEASNEQLAKFKTADQVLRCCSYIAAVNRDAELANAVIARCLRLVSPTTNPDTALRLFLFSLRACAAHDDREAYYREVGTVATRFAYVVPLSTALEMRKVLEIMKSRDPRLAASFGRAEAILEAELLAVAA